MLKELHYQGFWKPCMCHYGIAEVDGKPAVLFVQGSLTNTSITNAIEVLASMVLARDFAGRKPDEVRFFEHYPPALQPLAQWQEVQFAEAYPLQKPAKGLLARLRRRLKGDDAPAAWAVDDPHWQFIPNGLVPPALASLVH